MKKHRDIIIIAVFSAIIVCISYFMTNQETTPKTPAIQTETYRQIDLTCTCGNKISTVIKIK